MTNHTAHFTPHRYAEVGFCGEGDLVRPSRDNFAENLAEFMRRQEISGAELGRRVGRTRGAIAKWLDGSQEPSFEDKDAIAKALGIPVARLFEDPTDARTTGIEIDTAIRMVVEAAKKGSSQ